MKHSLPEIARRLRLHSRPQEVTRIAHAIEAVMQGQSYKFPALTVIRTLSWLSLAYRRPVWVSVYRPSPDKSSDGTLIVSTLTDNDMLWYGLQAKGGQALQSRLLHEFQFDGLLFRVYLRLPQAPTTHLGWFARIRAAMAERSKTSQLCNELECSLGEQVKGRLAKVFDGWAPPVAVKHDPVEWRTIHASFDAELGSVADRAIREELGRVIKESAQLAAFKREGTPTGSATNLLWITRRPIAAERQVSAPSGQQTVRFGYTSGYLFEQTQKDDINRWFDQGKDIAGWLERPMEGRWRSLADSVFESGCIDLSVASERDPNTRQSRFFRRPTDDPQPPWVPESKSPRDVHEKALLNEFLRPKGAPGGEEDLLYFPIHVDGVAWVCAFTLVGPDLARDRETWAKTYHVYRDLIPNLAVAVRRAAIASHATVVAHIFNKHMSELRSNVQAERQVGGSDPFAAMNKACAQLCLYWPFPRLRFEPTKTSPDGSAPRLPFCIRFDANPLWGDRFQASVWPSLLTEESLERQLEPLLVNNENLSASAAQQAYYSVAHIVGNLLPAVGMGDLLSAYTKRDTHAPKFELTIDGEPDPESARFLCDALVRARGIIEAIELVMQLMRVMRDGWVLPHRKWQATKPYKLGQVIQDAVLYAERITQPAKLALTVDASVDAIEVSARYIKSAFIRSILFELFRNVLMHGDARGEARPCSIRAERAGRNGGDLLITVSNPIIPAKRKDYGMVDSGLWIAGGSCDGQRRDSFLSTLIWISRQQVQDRDRSSELTRAPFCVNCVTPSEFYVITVLLREACFRDDNKDKSGHLPLQLLPTLNLGDRSVNGHNGDAK